MRIQIMPVTYNLNRKAGFIETQCKGNVTFEDVMGHFRKLEADPALPKRLDVFLDLDQTTSLPTSNQLRDVARTIKQLKAKVEWGACAILVSSDALYGMSRMFTVFTESLFAQSRVFRKRDEAEHWLSSFRKPAA